MCSPAPSAREGPLSKLLYNDSGADGIAPPLSRMVAEKSVSPERRGSEGEGGKSPTASARGGSRRAPSPSETGWRDGWFILPYEVTWRDLDAIGHVNNAVYFSYFEWARTKYWFELKGGSTATDLGFIVARAECDFRLELGLTEMIDIGVRIGELRNSSLDFVYEIRKATGAIAATGKVVVVLIDWKTKNKLQITPEFRARIQEFQGS